MNELQIFKNETFGEIRIIMKDNEPWFVAKDVCHVLEISNSRDALARLDDDEKDGVGLIDAIGRKQNTSIINEAGLYTLVLGSRKPEAKEFKRWITHEVIPVIRRTGSYKVASESPYAPNVIFKKYKGMSVLTKRDVSEVLKVKYESINYLLGRQKNKFVQLVDYIIIRGKELAEFKVENKIVNKSIGSITVILESGFKKICKFLGLESKLIPFPQFTESEHPKQLSLIGKERYSNPESNPEIKAWIENIRGCMNTLDGLLEKYGQGNTLVTQEALKEVLKSISADIFVHTVMLTREKYQLVK